MKMKILDDLIARCKRFVDGPIPKLKLAPQSPRAVAEATGAAPGRSEGLLPSDAELPHFASAREAQQQNALAEYLLELHRATHAFAYALGAQPGIQPERFRRDFRAAAVAIWNTQGETPPTAETLMTVFDQGRSAWMANKD